MSCLLPANTEPVFDHVRVISYDGGKIKTTLVEQGLWCRQGQAGV